MRFPNDFCIRAACIVALSCGVWAQTPAPASPGATAEPPKDLPGPGNSNWTWKTLQLTGAADAYYGVNFNHPADDRNQLHNFDLYGNAPNLSYAKFGLSKAAAPIGFQLDAGGGPLFNWFHTFDPNRDGLFMHHVLQAYVSIKPAAWKGVQVDLGKFYTSAGAEVTETHLNWSYSRPLLFALGPYYHVGMRTTVPVGKNFTTGFQLVNGWNNLHDNNSGKTMGFTTSATMGKVTWSNAFYTGPEHTDTNKGWRHFYDTVLMVNANAKSSFYLNFDYGVDRNVGGGESKFYGIAGATKYSVTDKVTLVARGEWYNDRDGWASGMAQKLKEYTLTGEYKLLSGLLARLEWRQDFSDQLYFHRGNDQLVKRQSTLTLGVVMFFGPKS